MKRNLITSISNISAVVMVAAMVGLAGCASDFTSPVSPAGTTITQVAVANDSLKAFVAALNITGLKANFDNVNGGQYTLFAPSNYAFIKYLRSTGIVIAGVSTSTAGDAATAAINALTVSSTPLTISGLATRLNYHIISASLPSNQITGAQVFVTWNSARLSVSKVSSGYVLNANVAGNGATITAADKTASNGVLHIIDAVMSPVSNANIWVASLLNFSVNYSVSPITVSIGSTSIPKDGSGNFDVSTAPTNATDGDFNLFSMALVRAGLATTIIPNVTVFPDFTAFAPTDGAFKAYLNVTTEVLGRTAINGMTPDALAAIVKYHFVSGRILSTDLAAAQSVGTLAGKNFTVNINGSTYTITDLNATSLDATITGKDKLTNAGIVHVINGVLQPN